GLGDGSITPHGVQALRARLLEAGRFDRLLTESVRPDRAEVLPGGFAILRAIVDTLKPERIDTTDGALRQGILWDLLGRVHHHDMRDVTVAQFMQRYHVHRAQARRVAALAIHLAGQVVEPQTREAALQLVGWAAQLHEIGISVAYNGYHKHSAYIVRNADMPGFSRTEQERLALLVLAHRRQLRRVMQEATAAGWPLLAALRLAVVFHRSRSDSALPPLALEVKGRRLRLGVPAQWLRDNPLTATMLRDEMRQWRAADGELVLRLTDTARQARERSSAA